MLTRDVHCPTTLDLVGLLIGGPGGGGYDVGRRRGRDSGSSIEHWGPRGGLQTLKASAMVSIG